MSIAQKVQRLSLIIKQNGGLRGSLLTFMRSDELKWGNCVGEDKFGNKYYENKEYFIGRSRWVKYPDRVGYDYDASQVSSDWHAWLHYMTDETPAAKPPTQRKWMDNHTENFSGTSKEYVPYSTTKPKIEAWDPNKKN